ncbi:RNA-binding transcriptional accessory protein [Clostridia bacterium]|nr:RNA-binding transcriptional accessory protein [Clostridia bacterium]
MDKILLELSKQFNLKYEHVEGAAALLDEGNTVPFIARYRKERTGAMDDQVLREMNDRLVYLRNLEQRRSDIASHIEELGKMTGEISQALESAATLTELDDIYRPFRPKRRTRATVARERGLEPLAVIIFRQDVREGSLTDLAAPYVNPEKDVETPEQAINGACDIIAEDISDISGLRRRLRDLVRRSGALRSKCAAEQDSVYRLYYDFHEPISRIPGHRILAINRGEREEFLKVGIEVERESALRLIDGAVVKQGSITTEAVRRAGEDAWDRLIFPSIERELRSELTAEASEQAIRLFSDNLKQLLMQPPVKGKITLGLDPAYRTGCKIAVVDATGRLLETAVIYPTPPQSKTEEAAATMRRLVKAHGVSLISIGNGTASRESEIFVADLIPTLDRPVSYMVVNEAGASVYSASKLAAEEFPEHDVSLRSAVSIARRLQDPLAELVKIDPKSIGVGQYQHDMPQARMDESLSGVVESCVNAVGVDLNTASAPLLSRVSGIGPSLAKNIVAHREAGGAFRNRRELLKVSKLGPKAFTQSAGFLRVPESDNILDNTAVHPESYGAALKLLELCGYGAGDVTAGNLSQLRGKFAEVGESAVSEAAGVGIPTLRDIIDELTRPGRDPRDDLPPPMLRTDVLDIKDLTDGMELTGVVRNVIDFGVFVDIGVHQDGLIHISQLADRFVRHPSDVLKVGDIVKVSVLSVEREKKRISLKLLSK